MISYRIAYDCVAAYGGDESLWEGGGLGNFHEDFPMGRGPDSAVGGGDGSGNA